ncbi:MAG: Citrate lyase acyl carrier protein [Oscillospiraceae bacterium]|jgi:citrate lyase subunit gamma (acyl carrier protein)
MQIKQTAVSGTLESSDIMVTVSPSQEEKIEIDLKSQVEKQFGNEIKKTIIDVLKTLNISSAKVTAVDKGALDCVIRARTETAVCRACGQEYKWGGADSCN